MDGMKRTGDMKVSERGQMSLPAAARHRWGLAGGGDIGFIDLGEMVVLVPGGVSRLRRDLLDAVTEDDWERARSGFGDAELAAE
jgi:bifunctional DNA-binding transcriptional regulator/antitoxin component of YhaV-PrlF toxin-antitoxin module